MESHVVPDSAKISPFLVYYVIISLQVGIGVLSYQRILAKQAGHDGWISIVIIGIVIHIIMWMMFKMAETAEGDIISVHQYVIGNMAGKVVSFLLVFYFMLYIIIVLLNFIEVIQIWMFPDLSTFWFSLALMILSTYLVFGGFRTVVGSSFFGLVLPAYLVLTFVFTFRYTDFTQLLPIAEHSITDLLKGSYYMSLTVVGFEILLFVYPFIKEPKKSKKWAHLAVLTTTVFYTLLALISFAYFSEAQLQKTIWGTLSMWQIVQLPFVERFEYIGVANWILILLPNIVISLWVASRLLKRTTKLRQRKGTILISVIVVIVVKFFDTGQEIQALNDLTEKIIFGFAFVYIPLLFFATMITKRVKKR
ncbi:GerAB/ArcD/ProY family transporter [Cytobacillus purgationiresistens]|uniref:Spore germination protein (Amino acid permease) n=1 Tax=Cytobacillus purgationiresistens TaxID=863449 RepID=A0ABU0ANZ6_9BACI|nr:GerAB/ArcD/ProY family transporter [Cytobacillus purgationiresistens]MDQ0273016.1 spore germination protein (amino acid permease) [Cytobacillus purgationiresistens]